MYRVFCAAMLAASCSTAALAASDHAHHQHHQGPPTPAGVMGAHLMPEGGFMVGYHFQRNGGDDVRDGHNKVDPGHVVHTYGEVMTEMQMDMHMLDFMYGLTDDLSIMVMPQYMNMEMTHLGHGHFGAHNHEVSGWGDTEVTGLYRLFDDETHHLHLNAGLSLPTGEFDGSFVNHHNVITPLPYNMQFGSGTFDPILGLTYQGNAGDWGWGAQYLHTQRLGRNDDGWQQGNRDILNLWGSYLIGANVALSGRVEGESWGDVDGRNTALRTTAIAGADPQEIAGERIYGYLGVTFFATEAEGALFGHQLALEAGLPIYQRYDGPTTESDSRILAVWSAHF